MIKRLFALLCVSLLTFALVPAPAGADDHGRAFRGTISGTVHFEPTDDPACVVIPVHTVSEGIGRVTHLGRATMASEHCAGNTIAGDMTLTAEHGSVVLSYSGDCTPVPPFPEEVTCDLDFAVSGGTGRFEGASGSGSMIGLIHPDLTLPDPLLGTWTAEWSMMGRISY